jgi:putative flippase GtrA
MKSFVKFCTIGVVNTAITFSIFYFLNQIMGVNYLASSFMGYIAGVISSFSFNKSWTFNNKDSNSIFQFAKFTILNLFSLGINLLILYICVEKFLIPKVAAQIVATGFTTICNFLGSKIFVFAPTRKISTEELISDIPVDLQKIE